ncbi:MAG TPA: carboxylesterase family protein [Candidatus Dormibacteraeota bacterium]|nr:carboxylesterase family protein [Candidatus Dormibacteraeota bacterium]
MRKRLIAAVVTAQVLLLATFIAAQDTVTIETGKVKGFVSEGVLSFKGVPYAAPAIGDLRWRPPQPAAKWSGVREANAYGHDCMQLPFPSDAAPLGTAPAEDCLVLNVWGPEQRAGKLPVLVWIYGGGFVNGGSSPAVYDGTQFAKRGLVFISFNYRIGRFGFFAHPALTRESKDGLLGNYGYMDQIAAMKWVQRNIAAFGGDPHQVTVFGESAGGGSVHMLITSPMSAGLFQRAVVESGGGRALMPSTGLHEGKEGRPSGEEVGVAFAKKNGIMGDDSEALKKLRALPAETVVDGLNMASMDPAASTYPGPMIDGKIVTNTIEVLYKDGKYQHVPMIVGANSMDIGFARATTVEELFAPFGADSEAAKRAYDADQSKNLRELGMKVAADQLMIEPARFVAATLSSQGGSVWEYRFAYVAGSMRSQWSGAPHATEIPFVFDTVKTKYGAQLTSEDESIAQQTNNYWANFAKSGDPNGAGLPKWPRYSTADELLIIQASGPTGEHDPWKVQLDLVQKLAENKRKP